MVPAACEQAVYDLFKGEFYTLGLASSKAFQVFIFSS